MAATDGTKLIVWPIEVIGATTHFVTNVVESFASAGFGSLHGLPPLPSLLLLAALGTTSGAAKICRASHGQPAASLNGGHGSMLANESRLWQMTSPGCLFDSHLAMAADNVLGKADAEVFPPLLASTRCFVERAPYSSTNRPATLGRAHEGSPPSRLAAPSAATTINGALVAIDEAPYMSAGPDLGGRACGAL